MTINAEPTSAAGSARSRRDSIIGGACRFAANALFQFPPMFRMQQALFKQPTLIRSVIEQELAGRQSGSNRFRVLDFGCGCGTYAGLFSPEEYVGVDSSERMLARARKQHPSHTFLQASDTESIHDMVEDVSHIFLIGVIHHLSDEAVVSVLSAFSRHIPRRVLTIDTLRAKGGPGALIQLFERGSYLRSSEEYRALLQRVITDLAYEEMPYGGYLRVAVLRGAIRTSS